jgi:hypothetical protein
MTTIETLTDRLLAAEAELARQRALVVRARALLANTPPLQPAHSNEQWLAAVARWMADASIIRTGVTP